MLRNVNDKIAVVIFLVIFFIYLSTLSVSLDDEDSVHFALGLTGFDVTKYQPHPPGFPVYIAFGWVLNLIFNNEVLALTFMSALFGTLALFVFYFLAKEMFNDKIALFSSILMAFTPLFWLNSVKAMSDMTGLFFVLSSMFLIYRYGKYSKPLNFYAGAMLAGISAGVRVHSLFILLPLLFYSMYKHKKNFKTILNAGFLFVFAVLVWFVPLISITGVGEYFSSAQSQFMQRVDRPDMSLLGTSLTGENLVQRLIGFPYFFLLGGYGINLADPGLLSIILLLFIIVLGVLFLKKINPRDERFVFFCLAVIPYLIAVFAMLPPFNPRYLLIIIPVFSLAFTSVIFRIKNPNFRYLLFGFLLFLILFHSVFLALIIRTTPSPPVQLIWYVNKKYGPEDAVISGGFIEKYFTYYKTDLKRLPESIGCKDLNKLVSEGRKVLTISGSESCENLKLERIVGFYRDPRVHLKRSMINLYEFLPE